jgi:hypothetical protein
VLTQRIEQAHPRLKVQFMHLAVDGEHNRPGGRPEFGRPWHNVPTHGDLLAGCELFLVIGDGLYDARGSCASASASG